MAGYSSTPLLKKLGIKSGFRMYVHQPPSPYFDWLHPLPEKVDVAGKLSGEFDFIHLFVKDQKTFREIVAGRQLPVASCVLDLLKCYFFFCATV